MSAACGVCGRTSIDDLLARCEPVPPGEPLAIEVLAASVGALEGRQPGFERSGGMHAAAVLDAKGQLLCVHEDVGRHNAVDKVIGTLVLAGELEPPRAKQPTVLVVSGRVSFEIVQKAARARLRAVCGVSAPTSLAIDLAIDAGITLAGFVREGSLNLYSHKERIKHGSAPERG
jgi:FdhD protein